MPENTIDRCGRSVKYVKRFFRKSVTQGRSQNMSWEKRKGGREYYTRSRRVHGRVVRTYYGNGYLAAMAELEVHVNRQQRVRQRQELKKLQQFHEHLEITCMLWDKCLSSLSMLTLINAGFHLHGSSWRLKRPGKEAMNPSPSPNPTHDHPKTKEKDASKTQNASISEEELEQLMEKEPDLWNQHGDMYQKSIDHLLTAYLADNVVQKTSLKRKLKKQKSEWKGGGSSLEIAHAERLSLLWLQVYLAEMSHTEATLKQKTNFPVIRHLEKQYDQAQVRFERGLKSLVTIQVMLARKNQLAQKITNSMRSKSARSRVTNPRHAKQFNRVFADSTLQN